MQGHVHVCLLLSGLVLIASGLRAEPVSAGKPPADPNEELLKEQGIDTDPDAVRAFLRERAAALEGDRLPQFIRQLGSEKVEEREQATRELTRIGRPARAWLEKAKDDPDAEIASRAASCLRQIERNGRFATSLAAVRLLLKRQPARTVEALLQYLPFADDEDVEEEIGWGLYGMALERGELRPALRDALRDKLPARRAAAACIVGRRGTEADRTAVRKLLEDADPMVRLRAAQGLLAAGDKAGLSALIALLDEPALALCWQAEELLHWAAGGTAPKAVVGAATAAERKACREAWEAWHRADADKVDLKERLGDVRRPGLMLVCSGDPKTDDIGKGRVWLRGCDGQPRWQLAGGFCDAQLLPGDRLLLADAEEKRTDGAITERNTLGKILWNTTHGGGYMSTCRRLASGNTFITVWRADFREADPEGQIVPRESRSLSAKGSNPAGNIWPAGAPRKLSNGRLGWVGDKEPLLVESDPETLKALRVVRVNPGGDGVIKPLELLSDGHWLVKATKATTPFEVLEVERAGTVVRRYSLPYAASAARLRDGHTVFACGDTMSWNRAYFRCPLMELDGTGRKLWEEFPGGQQRRVRVCLPLVRLGFDQPPTAWVDLDSAEHRARGLKDKDPEVRLRAVLFLGELGPKAEPAVPGLIEALGDPDLTIRRNAEQALSAVGAGAVSAVVQALDDRRASVRVQALSIIGMLKYQSAIRQDAKATAAKVLAALLRDEDPLVRQRAANTAGWFADVSDDVVPALMRAMKDKAVVTGPSGNTSSVARGAINALGIPGARAKDAIPALLEVALGGDKELRSVAFGSLGSIGRDKAMTPIVLPLLLKIVEDKDQFKLHPEVMSALYAMRLQAAPAVPALREVLKLRDFKDADTANRIRMSVLGTLGELGPAAKDAVPELMALVQDKKLFHRDREQAIHVLVKIGSAAKAALPLLAEIEEDQGEEFSLRNTAAYGVRALKR
jgi:HEAT repeat protein